MKRWISSALLTLFFLTLLIFFSNSFLPAKKEGSSGKEKEEVSLVKIVKKQKPAQKKYTSFPQKEISETVEKSIEPLPLVKEEIEESNMDEVSDEDAYEEADETTEKGDEAFDGAGGVSNEVLRSYKAYVLSRIAGKKRYPNGARSRGQEGKVKMKIIIEADGTLSDAMIVKESEYLLLNEASLSAVKKASPFKKMPYGMRRQEYTFVIDYSLE